MLSFHERYLELRTELWRAFEGVVRRGAVIPIGSDVTYPRGVNPEGLSVDTEGRSWFRAMSIVAAPDYTLLKGENLIVGAKVVTFTDRAGNRRAVEPDILDLYWLSEIVDQATSS